MSAGERVIVVALAIPATFGLMWSVIGLVQHYRKVWSQ